MKSIKKISILLTLCVSLFSCQVGLGEIVDLQAPVVNVITPERTSYVKRNFSVIGTASDNTGVTSLEIKINPLDNPTEDNTLYFKLENKKWYQFAYNESTWKNYENENSFVVGSNTDFRWTLSYELEESVETGTDFNIITQVFDSYNNESKNSKDERSFTVDMKDPVVSLISPSTKTYEIERTFVESAVLKNNSILSNLLNGEFEISGSQKEDAKPDYLMVFIDEGDSYFEKNVTLEEFSKDTYDNLIIKKKVEGDNLRNWSTKVNPSLISGYETGKHVLRIITESHDIAGNIETKVQGWFTYYNEADIPWVNAAFGGDSYDSDKVAAVYPSCSLQGQAYDDDGLKSVEIKIYKYNDVRPVKEITFDLDSENNPTYKAWTINALGENCSFRVEVNCKDINNKLSETITRYMVVTDTNPPKIDISETNTNAPMLGDSNGKITLKGFVTDDGGIKSLKLLRVKTGTNPLALIDYYQSEYSEWGKATKTGYVDKNGNKIWELDLSEEEINGSIHKRTFTKDFNIFTDFGINGTSEKLTTQNFIIMAVDNGLCANIDSFTWAGDTTAPTLTIDKVVVKNGSSEKESINFAEYNRENKAKKLQPFESGDKIVLSGTWKDNSTDNWNTTLKNKRGKVSLNWEGATVTVTTNNDGTWQTNEITPPNTTTAAILAEFSDVAGNTTKVNESFFVSSSNPELIRITAQEPDGSYKAGDKIHIVLEFNKAVTFAKGTGNPNLLLNTNKTASYSSGNNTTNHVFEYVIGMNEDINALDVTSITLNGNTWTDTDNLSVKNMNISAVTTNNRLNKTRTIRIDTVKPKFNSITAITPKGYYNAGKEIFIQAEFTEEISISNVEKIKLNVNTKANGTTDENKTIQTGPKSILFTYTIADKDNANPLALTGSINLNGAVIKDNAGNVLDATLLPGTINGINDIVIDTNSPGIPVITGINNGDFIYESTGASFEISNFSDDVLLKKYSLDSGKTWLDYTGKVFIKDDGEYILVAKQQDSAGNESGISDAIKFNIDAGNILTSVSAGVPTGTYTTNDVIPIYLNFRKKVVVNGASLSLNLSNGQKAEYKSAGSTDTKALFEYKIQDGDASDSLNVESISGTFKDEKGNDINKYVTSIPTGKNLADSRVIKIVTGKPIVQNVELSSTGDKLTITFSKAITKGSGKDIIITQKTGTYKAAPVLTKAQYDKYLAASPTLNNYYEIGTNGSDANSVSDLTEKYILKYKYNSDGTWDGKKETDANWLSVMTTAKADKVIMSVNSTYVVVNGNKLEVSLTGSYALPVKGAEYTVSIPADLVKDIMNHGNDSDNTRTISLGGIEKPVIRINKVNETITKSGSTTTITQPLQASVKIDCQTPGIETYYVVTNSTNNTVSLTETDGKPHYKTCNNNNPNTITEANIKASNKKGESFSIGSTNKDDYYKGFRFLIGAMSKKNSTWSLPSYETAYRTVVVLNNNGNKPASTYTNFFVRGGDYTSGGVTAKDMPFSWESSEFDKIRAMTKNGTADTWYWITWKLNITSYVGFVAGDAPNDVATNGPKNWVWGDCGFNHHKSYYPLLPGSSLTFNNNVNWGYWYTQYQEKKQEYRDDNGVVHKVSY